MTTRLLMLPAAMAGLFALSGCFRSNDPEQAPPPRPQGEKTKAELLVGKWKLVKRTPPMKPFVPMMFEYKADGTCVLVKNNPLEGGPEVQTGTYRVEGDTLFRTMDTNPMDRNTTIESISDEKLVTSGSRTGERQVHEYERVREN